MAIFDLYFKRQRRLKGEVPDVYLYDQMPHALRVQIVHVWDDTLGNAAEAGVSGRPDMAYSNQYAPCAGNWGSSICRDIKGTGHSGMNGTEHF